MKGHPNKADHPWKKPLSPGKAVQDRETKKEAERLNIESPAKKKKI